MSHGANISEIPLTNLNQRDSYTVLLFKYSSLSIKLQVHQLSDMFSNFLNCHQGHKIKILNLSKGFLPETKSADL